MTDDVLPSEFPLFVTENLIESRMVGMDPSVKAAAKALLDARMNPGSLIKITCSNSDECARVGQVLAHTIVVNNLHRETNTIGSDEDGWPILELRNGSGILVTIDRKGSREHGKRG
jgi:hypothetical protein